MKQIKCCIRWLKKWEGKETLKDEFFHAHGWLSYLSDIFSSLNEVNKKLRGKETSILFQPSKIRYFIAKLKQEKSHSLLWANDG